MASYTKNEMNQKLAKDIWSEKLGVAYEDIGKDYGKYTDGSGKLILSKDLLGGGKEDSAKLAAVMGHEGSHYYGNKLEGIAHAQGYDTYAQINKIFNLEGDSSFVNSMLDGILSKESWVANTGDTQHWKLAKTENGGWGWKEDGSLDFNIDTSDPAMHLLLAGDPKLKQLFSEGNDKNTHTMTYEDMKDNVGKVGFALNRGMDGLNIKNLMNFVGGTQHLANASTSANNVMALLAKDGNKTITPQERVQISNTLGVFMDSLYNAQNSGLLVKNDYTVDTKGLVGSGTVENPYLPVRADKNGIIYVTGYEGFRLVENGMLPGNPNFPVNDFAKNEHTAADFVGGGDVIASFAGSLKLNYSHSLGLQSIISAGKPRAYA